MALEFLRRERGVFATSVTMLIITLIMMSATIFTGYYTMAEQSMERQAKSIRLLNIRSEINSAKWDELHFSSEMYVYNNKEDLGYEPPAAGGSSRNPVNLKWTQPGSTNLDEIENLLGKVMTEQYRPFQKKVYNDEAAVLQFSSNDNAGASEYTISDDWGEAGNPYRGSTSVEYDISRFVVHPESATIGQVANMIIIGGPSIPENKIKNVYNRMMDDVPPEMASRTAISRELVPNYGMIFYHANFDRGSGDVGLLVNLPPKFFINNWDIIQGNSENAIKKGKPDKDKFKFPNKVPENAPSRINPGQGKGQGRWHEQ